MKQSGLENKWKDRQIVKLLIVKQILPVCAIDNV